MLIGARRDKSSGASLWPAALFVWGPGEMSSSHSHHSVQLILALQGRLRARPRRGVRWRSCSGVFVAPGAVHEVDARGATVLIGFMDPESELAAPLVHRFGSTMVTVPDAVVAQWRQALGEPQALDARHVEAWVRSELLNESHPRRIHPRVRRVLQFLRQQGLEQDDTSLERLAQIAELSPSRLMHVFTESLGIPLRPYLLWLRVQGAAGALVAGHTVTEAAHLVGFADAAHLTRTFRRTLGTTPSELISRAAAANEVRLAAAKGGESVPVGSV
jgi:AraC-like DNA-binding protein